MLKSWSFFAILLQFPTLVFPSVETECFGRNRICTSLSSTNPDSWDSDFSRFRKICLDQTDPKLQAYYTDGFKDSSLKTTKTIFSMYSLCHEGYPVCREEGLTCFCNTATKQYFETQAYLSFVACRKSTNLERRKGQSQYFFQLSFNYTTIRDVCDVEKILDSEWVKQYWNSIKYESTKKQILKYCRRSAVKIIDPSPAELETNNKFVPSSYCFQVSDILKQFQFVGGLGKQQYQQATLFGVGLIAYCGACDCCEVNTDGQLAQSIITYIGGDVYEGTLKDGKRNGEGVYTFAEGDVYRGSWKDNSRNGQGVMTNSNGDVYEGSWKDGKRNGEGVYTWFTGGTYSGQVHKGSYKDGYRNGQGVLTSSNGDVYKGSFKDDKKNGKGMKTYANGYFYEGSWKDDKIVV